MRKTIEDTLQQMLDNAVLIATESQIKDILKQFNHIDLENDDAVDKYMMELGLYKNCTIIPDV